MAGIKGSMTIEETSKRYNIPIEILKMYEKWNLCGEVKNIMGSRKYDDKDIERLGMIMTLHNMGFNNSEIEKYMRLYLKGEESDGAMIEIIKKKRAGRIVIDIIMSLLLLFLMAYQVTGGKYHEWLGAAMLVLFIVHNVLNFKWYKQLFKGRYSAARVLRVVVNFITLISIILTGYSGIKMSQYVFNFIPVNSGLMMARKLHLAFSYWSFVFMSIHLGLHWSMVTAKFNKLGQVFKWILRVVAAGAAVYGAYLFGKSGIYTYMFMKVMFAMLDFKSPAVVVIINNLFMMSTWCFVGYYLNKALLKKKNVLYCLLPVAIVVISIFCTFKFAENISFGNDSDWSAGSFDNGNSGEYVMSNTSNLALPDNFIYINGGTFNMGSPETENWRSSDETLHEVKVNSFYMSAYELTQKEYMEICGNNPSTFS